LLADQGFRRDVLIVLGLFGASTLLYALLGVRFDPSQLASMQFIDAPLLANRLLESLWYYHATPPMLNLLTGIGMKLFGQHANWFFVVLFHAIGLLAVLCLYALTRYLSGSRVAGLVTAGVVAFSPSFVLYQNWLQYEFPATSILVLATFALYQFVQTKSTKWCATFFALLAALALTRSLFHIAWVILIVALLAVVMKERWRQVVLAAVLPVLVVAAWYGKNYYLFGRFATSTWMGLGLSNISTLMVPTSELIPLVEQGKLSTWAVISRYEHMDVLFLSRQTPPTGIPVLDAVRKSNGEFNFNHRDLPIVDRYYTADALAVIREFPSVYVIGLIISNRLYFSPTNMNMFFSDANRQAVRPMEWIFNPLLAGARPTSRVVQQPHFGFDGPRRYTVEVNTGRPLIAAWILVLGFGYARARGGLRAENPNTRAAAVVTGFIVLTAAYLYVLSTTIELAENSRYRFEIEPLFIVLAATAITSLVRSLRQRFATPQLTTQPERMQ
jgi:hypothetical protein